jgi:hypothetical protein
MNIAVGSAFRNCAGNVSRYMRQVQALQDHAGIKHHVRVIAVEGDSVDKTEMTLYAQADAYNIDLTLIRHDHGKRKFGSTEDEDRIVALSGVGNAIFDGVRETDDALVYVESDLLWNAHTIGSLLDMALRQDSDVDVFAPRITAGSTFYDIWGFRHLDGRRFSPFEDLKEPSLIEVGSVGSCLVMRGEVARRVRIRNNYCLVGWCEEARRLGYRIGVDTRFEVRHP